ncbi:MAG TPA: hypothetical protein DEP46_16940 [Blastocatellia bacterium]|nr:hypothetical protein [Blastocatellia bacterium]
MSGPGVLETAADTAACFERNTSVLLESENAQPSSVYCINAVHVGATGGGTTSDCLITPGPKVLSVNYELIHTDDLPIDANPNAGGGLRIFPDKKTPNETVDRRRIRVKAQYSQMTAGIRIYFRNFDVDDPSADTAPIDANDTPTLKTGNDNNGNVDGTSATRAGVLHVPPSGQPNPYNCQAFSNANASGVSCETDANGVAIVEYTLTMQPGDNFAMVASPDEAYVSSLVHTADGINLKDANNIEIPVTTTTDNACASNDGNKACRSDMLSVWRRIHVEVDRMGNVGAGNNVTGTIAVVGQVNDQNCNLPQIPNPPPPDPPCYNTSTAFQVTTSDGNPLEAARFNDGRIVIGNRSFRIWSNTANIVVLRGVPNQSGRVRIGDVFTLYDDDDYNNNDVLVDGDLNEPLVMLPESFRYLSEQDGFYPDGKPRNILESAYVRPEYTWAQSVANYNQTNLQFETNVEFANAQNIINRNRDSINAERDDFWIAYLLIGYQGATLSDFDGVDPANPNVNEAATQGITGNEFIQATQIPNCDCFNSSVCPAANPAPLVCVHPTTGNPVLPRGGYGSLIFQEVNQDLTQYFATAPIAFRRNIEEISITIPHEIGHQFGLLGDIPRSVFRVMDYSNYVNNIVNDVALHPEHINIIRRRTKSPGE